MQMPVAEQIGASNRLLAESKSFSRGGRFNPKTEDKINHHSKTGKTPSHSATPELLQLLTSALLTNR